MSQTVGESAKRLEIRKYPNRRYYDSTRSCHVTLEKIHALIRDGYEVQVVDSKTGQDITGKILAQIIIDLDAPKLGVFPVPMLHRLLQSNQEMVTDFVQKYFNQPLSAFLDSHRNMQQYLRQTMGLKDAPSGMSDWTRLMWGPLNPSFWTRSPGQSGSSPASPASPEPTNAPEVKNDSPVVLHELRQQIQALSRQVSKLQVQLGRKSKKGSAGKLRR